MPPEIIGLCLYATKRITRGTGCTIVQLDCMRAPPFPQATAVRSEVNRRRVSVRRTEIQIQMFKFFLYRPQSWGAVSFSAGRKRVCCLCVPFFLKEANNRPGFEKTHDQVRGNQQRDPAARTTPAYRRMGNDATCANGV